MVNKDIDKLMAIHFGNADSSYNLNNLEGDVWQKIQAIQADKPISRHEKIFLVFETREFRAASIIIALFIGLGMGGIAPQEKVAPASASREIGLHVFAANIEYLPSSIFSGKQ